MKQIFRRFLITLIPLFVVIGGIALGSTITTIQPTDTVSGSRTTINTNFSNLNYDKFENSSTLTISTTTNKVGIATTTPRDTLDVWGGLYVGTSSTPTLYVASTTGKIGIGTTSPASLFTVATTTNIFQVNTNGNVTLPKILNALLATDINGNIIATSSAASGVSSLNTFTGAQTLWGTGGGLTVTASGTAGLVFDVPNNATTGTSVIKLNGITGSAIIEGTANQITVASTSQTITLSIPSSVVFTNASATNLSITGLKSGILKVGSTGNVSTTTLPGLSRFSSDFATTTGNKTDGFHAFYPYGATISEINCISDGTVVWDFGIANENALATTSQIGSLTCITASASTTPAAASSTVAARKWIVGRPTSVTSATSSWGTIIYSYSAP